MIQPGSLSHLPRLIRHTANFAHLHHPPSPKRQSDVIQSITPQQRPKRARESDTTTLTQRNTPHKREKRKDKSKGEVVFSAPDFHARCGSRAVFWQVERSADLPPNPKNPPLLGWCYLGLRLRLALVLRCWYLEIFWRFVGLFDVWVLE